jgi:hypothetical protein
LVPEGRQVAGCRKLVVAGNNGTAAVQILAAAQEQGPKTIAVLAHSLAVVEADGAEHRLAAWADRLAVVAHRVAVEAHAVVEVGIAHRVELYTKAQQTASFAKDEEEHRWSDVRG